MRKVIENYKKQQIKQKAIMIVKYQNFKTNIALKKMEIKVSKPVYEAGVSYLKRGKITAPLSNIMKEAIDTTIKECIQPLRPTSAEERKWKFPIYQSKEAKPPICALPIIHKKLTTKFDYGVLVNNCIKILDSEKEARIFLEGIKFINGEGKLLEIEIKEIK